MYFCVGPLSNRVALAEWLRRVPAKYMGFPRESSNLSGDVKSFFFYSQKGDFIFLYDQSRVGTAAYPASIGLQRQASRSSNGEISLSGEYYILSLSMGAGDPDAFGMMPLRLVAVAEGIRGLGEWKGAGVVENTQGLIFVVDSNDTDRVVEARDELHRMLNELLPLASLGSVEGNKLLALAVS
ncbi:hypothetical protein F0562_029984 [Nyssa sinensis]|uniref:Uncharacterized protein n=1 Tax=Nyssa sinensis TaxID=561372 RepID=A0A5J5B1H4_9ASTE|nr:hypothetical protein F0562_029984 [Nyssa sinensis]